MAAGMLGGGATGGTFGNSLLDGLLGGVGMSGSCGPGVIDPAAVTGAVDSPEAYLATYCDANSGPCINPERKPQPPKRAHRKLPRHIRPEAETGAGAAVKPLQQAPQAATQGLPPKLQLVNGSYMLVHDSGSSNAALAAQQTTGAAAATQNSAAHKPVFKPFHFPPPRKSRSEPQASTIIEELPSDEPAAAGADVTASRLRIAAVRSTLPARVPAAAAARAPAPLPETASLPPQMLPLPPQQQQQQSRAAKSSSFCFKPAKCRPAVIATSAVAPDDASQLQHQPPAAQPSTLYTAPVTPKLEVEAQIRLPVPQAAATAGTKTSNSTADTAPAQFGAGVRAYLQPSTSVAACCEQQAEQDSQHGAEKAMTADMASLAAKRLEVSTSPIVTITDPTTNCQTAIPRADRTEVSPQPQPALGRYTGVLEIDKAHNSATGLPANGVTIREQSQPASASTRKQRRAGLNGPTGALEGPKAASSADLCAAATEPPTSPGTKLQEGSVAVSPPNTPPLPPEAQRSSGEGGPATAGSVPQPDVPAPDVVQPASVTGEEAAAAERMSEAAKQVAPSLMQLLQACLAP